MPYPSYAPATEFGRELGVMKIDELPFWADAESAHRKNQLIA